MHRIVAARWKAAAVAAAGGVQQAEGGSSEGEEERAGGAGSQLDHGSVRDGASLRDAGSQGGGSEVGAEPMRLGLMGQWQLAAGAGCMQGQASKHACQCAAGGRRRARLVHGDGGAAHQAPQEAAGEQGVPALHPQGEKLRGRRGGGAGAAQAAATCS